ncbi:hypothetical protein TruAng_006096 [Truncatella angustata]|nr:hypothetical protein TruAng_006096 [Truncatella angustata]
MHGKVQIAKIQVPYANLDSIQLPLVARFLEKDGPGKITLIDNLSAVRDNIKKGPYNAEAHGVVVKAGDLPGDLPGVCPIWAYLQPGKVNLQEPFWIDVVEFNYCRRSKIKSTFVCWVPHLQSANGHLITILNGMPRLLRGTVVIVQIPGLPSQTQLVWKEAAELTRANTLPTPVKLALFNAQLAALQSFGIEHSKSDLVEAPATSEELPALVHDNWQRLISLSNSHATNDDTGNSAQVDEDIWSDWSNEDGSIVNSDVMSSTDEDHLVSGVQGESEASNDCSFFCCKYADQRPTYRNRGKPRHWHKKNEECPLGAGHPQHCVFADAFPDDCVVNEASHSHCPPTTGSNGVFIPDTVHSTRRWLGNGTNTAIGRALYSSPDVECDARRHSFEDESSSLVHAMEHEFDMNNPTPPTDFPVGYDLTQMQLSPGRDLSTPNFFEDDDVAIDISILDIPVPDSPAMPWIPRVRLNAMRFSPAPLSDSDVWS